MRLASRYVLLAVAATVLVAPPAFSLIFSSSCDRFEIDGNNFGSPGGALDFVDDFNNGTLAPDWSVLLGTVQETGGNLVAHNPGLFVQLGTTQTEISTAEAEEDVSNGAGNFTMTSYWQPTLPNTNAGFHMQLYTQSPIIEAAGLTVTNDSAQVAAAQGGGTLAGPSVSQSLTQGVGPGFTTLQFNTVPIIPATITGKIALRMAFNDATDTLTCSFSLDGGTTFLSPFPPIHIFNAGVADYDILLGASAVDAAAPPPPPATVRLPLSLLLLKNPSSAASRRVVYKAMNRRGTPAVIFGNPTTTGATLALKVDAHTQCFFMPASHWSRQGSSYKYKDPGGGPVKTARIKQMGNGKLQNKVVIVGSGITITPPNPGHQGDTNFFIPAGASYCASTTGGTIKPNDARTFKARNAPAPAACYVAACSPSGAFLDDAAPF